MPAGGAQQAPPAVQTYHLPPFTLVGEYSHGPPDRRLINDHKLSMGIPVTTLQIGSYSGLDSSPYGIPSGNHIEDRPVYLVYYR